MTTYCVDKFVILLMLGIGLFPLYLQAEDIKCWVNAEGVTECGNVVPQDETQKGVQERAADGQLINKIDAAKSEEEIEKEREKEELARQRKEREAEDRKLLALFSSEEDIQGKLHAVVSTIDGQITAMQTIVESLRKNLEDLEANLEKGRDNPDVPPSQLETIERNIQNVKQRLKDNEQSVENKRQEKEQLTQEYTEYLRRYKDIKRRGIGALPAETEATKPAKTEATTTKPVKTEATTTDTEPAQ